MTIKWKTRMIKGEFGLLWPESVPTLQPDDLQDWRFITPWIEEVFGDATRPVSIFVYHLWQRHREKLGDYSPKSNAKAWNQTMKQLGYDSDA